VSKIIKAADRAALIILILQDRMPERSPERAIMPGVALSALWASVADYGHDYDAKDMAAILREAQSRHNLPRAIVEQLIATFPTYQAVTRELENIEFQQFTLPALKELQEKALRSAERSGS